MHVDLIQRVHYLNRKGDQKPLESLLNWIDEITQIKGTNVEIGGRCFNWKFVKSDSLNHFVNDDRTDWFLLNSDDFNFILLGEVIFTYEDYGGKQDNPLLCDPWIIKSDFEGLIVEKENRPIKINSPLVFTSPIHRLNFDIKNFILKLMDVQHPLFRHTYYDEWKTYKSDIIQLR